MLRLDTEGVIAAEYVEVPATEWGDVVGDDVSRSNHRSLLRDYPETFIVVDGAFNSHVLVLPLDAALDRPLAEKLVMIAEEYPIYDEEDLSALLEELAEDAWDAYLRADVHAELGERGVDPVDFDPAELRRLFYEANGNQPEPYRGEGADNVVFPYLRDTIDALTVRLGGG